MVVSIGDLLSAVNALREHLDGFSKEQQINSARFFKTIDESYKKIELIHKDYTENLSKLSQFLREREIPPRELLSWLRNEGIKYQSEREYLSTIEVELANVDYGKFIFRKNKTKLQSALSEYIKSILRYYDLTMSPSEWSFYRDYEYQLGMILRELEKRKDARRSDKVLAMLFYETENVKTIHDALIDICDRRLPERWKEVSLYYRTIRALLGYPTLD